MLKKWLELITPAICLGLTFWAAFIWFAAFFNNDAIIVTINDYGERDIELFFWFVLLPILTYGTVTSMRKVFNESFRIR